MDTTAAWCCARVLGNNLSEESTNQMETDAARDVFNMHKNRKNNRDMQSTQYLTRSATSSGKGERDFIDSTINYNLFLLQRIFKEDFQRIFRDTIHEASSLIYNHRVPEI